MTYEKPKIIIPPEIISDCRLPVGTLRSTILDKDGHIVEVEETIYSDGSFEKKEEK